MQIETRNFVQAAFRAILGREPDDAGREQATAALDHGLSPETFLSNMIHSPEYVSRMRDEGEFTSFTPACAEIDGRRLWLDLSDMYVSRVCLMGNYEPNETAFVRANLQPGDTFLDIGANIGWFTTLAAQIVGPGGTVHAFEPRDETRGLLARSIVDNGIGKIVELHDAIVTDRAGVGQMIWHGADNPGGSRMISAVEKKKVRFHHNAELQDAPAIAIDDLNLDGRLSLIKMDIEGAETLALKGAAKTLKRHRPIILTEVYDPALKFVSGSSAADFYRLAKRFGYRAHVLDGGRVGAEIRKSADLVTKKPTSVVLLPT